MEMNSLARESKSLTCQYCNTTFSKPYSLALHLLDHTEKENSCRHCDKTFMTRNDLDAHERTHTEVKIWTHNEHTYVLGNNSFSGERTHKNDEISRLSVRSPKQDGISFPCRHCDESFSTRKDLAFHMRSHRSFKAFGYQNSNIFSSKEDAVTPDPPVYTIDTPSPEKSFTCQHCGQSFDSMPDLYNHESTHSQLKSDLKKVETAKTVACNQCDEKFRTQLGLKTHLRDAHGPKYTCPHCSFKCTKKYGLVVHLRVHSERAIFTCVHCGKTFKMFGCYENHVRTHEGKESPSSSTCSLCGEVFKSRTRLTAHLRLHEDGKVGPRLSEDGKTGPRLSEGGKTGPRLQEDGKTSLTVDLTDDSSESSISCRHCGDSFGSRTDLSAHLRSLHNEEDMPSLLKGEDLPSATKEGKMPILKKEEGPTPRCASSRRYNCHVCGKVFFRLVDLSNHLRHHMNNQEIVCGHCEKTFSTVSTLIHHYRYLDLTMPFPCPICKKSFDSRGALIRHLKVHRDGKPYHCEHCDKRFKLLRYLAKHHKRNHPHERFGIANLQETFVRQVKSDAPRVRSDVSPVKSNVSPVKSNVSPVKSDVLHRENSDVPHQGNSNVPERNPAVPRVKPDVPRRGNSVVPRVKSAVPRRGNSVASRVKSTVPQRRALTGEKPFSCQHCGMPFSSFSHLRRHMISHSHAELYLCHQCDKTFTSTSDLNLHMETHKEKLNICGKCNKMFKSKESLDRHVSLHSVSKYCPYACHVCKGRFGLELALKKHMALAHSVEFECDVCYKILYSKDSLRDHMSVHRRRRNESESDSDWVPYD